MGGSAWSDDYYNDRKQFRATNNQPTFGYNSKVQAQPRDQWAAHPTLDPKATSKTTGLKMRESRDSAAHPTSKPVIVALDVTGTMGQVPVTMQQELPKLMGFLIDKGYLEHPQIMISAIGDAMCDRVPLQVGQFESGIEIEDNLTNLLLEGGGGGQNYESYDLAVYFFARHTVHDAWEKRNEKGYCFIIGDEKMRPTISKREVAHVIGDSLESDLATTAVLRELQERYEVFFILPALTSNYNNPSNREFWKNMLPERFMLLDDPHNVSALIAGTVGMFESQRDVGAIAADLQAVGTNNVPAVTKALMLLGDTGKQTIVNVPDSGADSGLQTL